MKTVENLYENFKWPAQIEFATKEEANAWWITEAGKQRGSFVMEDITGLSIRFDNNFRNHVFEQNNEQRWSYVGNITDVLKKPDEVWSVKKATSLERYYIRYYDSVPMVVMVEDNEGLRAYTLVKKDHSKTMNYQTVEDLRKGVLIYRKK